MPRLLRLSRRDQLPIYEQVRAHTLIDPYKEVPLGRHYDDDGDGVLDAPDPGELDEHDHNQCACEPGHIGDPTGYDGPDAPEVPSA